MEEILDIVNENNEVIGFASEQKIYSEKLNHRTVHVLIFNSKGELFLLQRSANHAYCAGYWCAPEGVLRKGESYEKGAERTLDLWISSAIPIVQIHSGTYDHYKMRKFQQVFRAISEGPFAINNQYAISGKWFSIADLSLMISKNELIYPELAHVIEKLYPKPQAF